MINKIKEKLEVKEERIGTFNLFLLGAVSFIAIFSVSQFVNEKIIQIGLNNCLSDYQINQDIFVDQNSELRKSEGSPIEPFREISEALNFISENPEVENIYVKPGNYLGNLEIPENVNLFATWPETYILNSSLENETLILKGNNIVKGFTVKGGGYGIYIPKEAKSITLTDCKIEDASQYGIYNEEQSELQKNPQLEIIDSEISGNKQGLYLQKNSFLIKNTQVKENSNNGIVLNSSTNSLIIDSQISDNQENGIETDLENINLTIKNSLIQNNNLSGLKLKASLGETSEIKLENNSFTGNKEFGIDCSVDLDLEIKPPYFSKIISQNILQNNTFTNNPTSINPSCWK